MQNILNNVPKGSNMTEQISNAATRSVISADLKIDGNLTTTGEIEISGKVIGELGASVMTLRPTSEIEGQIVAEELIVDGTVKGTATANSISVGTTGVVQGSLTCEIIEISAGARIDGNITYAGGERPKR